MRKTRMFAFHCSPSDSCQDVSRERTNVTLVVLEEKSGEDVGLRPLGNRLSTEFKLNTPLMMKHTHNTFYRVNFLDCHSLLHLCVVNRMFSRLVLELRLFSRPFVLTRNEFFEGSVCSGYVLPRPDVCVFVWSQHVPYMLHKPENTEQIVSGFLSSTNLIA